VVGGASYAMQRDNGNTWSVDTDAPILVGDVAVASYDGDATPALSLVSCTAASSPSPTPSPSPTDPPGGVPVRGAAGSAQAGGGGSSLTGSATTPRTAGGPGRAANPPPAAPNVTSGAGPRDPGKQPARAVDPALGSGAAGAPYVAGTLEPAIADGSVMGAIPDPRKPPRLLVIGVLVIIASVGAVAAKRQLSRTAV
jgi:hypothetical protein